MIDEADNSRNVIAPLSLHAWRCRNCCVAAHGRSSADATKAKTTKAPATTRSTTAGTTCHAGSSENADDGVGRQRALSRHAVSLRGANVWGSCHDRHGHSIGTAHVPDGCREWRFVQDNGRRRILESHQRRQDSRWVNGVDCGGRRHDPEHHVRRHWIRWCAQQRVDGPRCVQDASTAARRWSVAAGCTTLGQIGAVRIHPTNPDVVWVAAYGDIFKPNVDRGIFKTTDGGKSWRKTLYHQRQHRWHGCRSAAEQSECVCTRGCHALNANRGRLSAARAKAVFTRAQTLAKRGRTSRRDCHLILIGKGKSCRHCGQSGSHLRVD